MEEGGYKRPRCLSPFQWNGQYTNETENRLTLAWVEKGEWVMSAGGYRVSFAGDENVLELYSGNGFCRYIKTRYNKSADTIKSNKLYNSKG